MEDLEIHVLRREKYAFTCCGRRVSWRAVRVVLFVSMALVVLGIVVGRAVAARKDAWTTAIDIAVALVAVFAPLP